MSGSPTYGSRIVLAPGASEDVNSDRSFDRGLCTAGTPPPLSRMSSGVLIVSPAAESSRTFGAYGVTAPFFLGFFFFFFFLLDVPPTTSGSLSSSSS